MRLEELGNVYYDSETGKIFYDDSNLNMPLLDALFKWKYENKLEQYEKIEDLNSELTRIKQEIEQLEVKENEYRRLGLLTTKSKTHYIFEYKYKDFKTLIDETWYRIWTEKELFYKKRIISCFMSALRTRQMIVLWGNPGSGKTSLPMAVADAIGAECTLIHVQSNWMDKQDLLGYYNPLDQIYYPTPFLEAIVQAKNEPNRLHMIVLDEMNLSHVEYYFSEMLNYLTWDDNQGDFYIDLYSRSIAVSEKELELMGEKRRNRYSFPPRFYIPNNIRIIGTLNDDETTKNLSPKVIDRSCLLQLSDGISKVKINPDYVSEIKKIRTSYKKRNPQKEYYVNSSIFSVTRVEKMPKDWEEELDMYETRLASKNIFLSNRLYSYVLQWLGSKDSCTYFDDVVYTKLLPLLTNYDEDILKIIIPITIQISTDSLLKEKIDNMLREKKSYWEC